MSMSAETAKTGAPGRAEFRPTRFRRALLFLAAVLACFGAAVGLVTGAIFAEAAKGELAAWAALVVIVLLPDLLLFSIGLLLDDAPSLFIGDDGFRYRLAGHDYGAFRWDQVIGTRVMRARGSSNVVITVGDRKLIQTRPGVLRGLVTALGHGAIFAYLRSDKPEGHISIPDWAVGGRIDEAQALLRDYVGEDFAS